MDDPSFVHLRLHSEYSIADGIVRIEDVLAAAKADGQQALALTDLNNVFGLIKFYQAAFNAGIKPILGCDVWVRYRPLDPTFDTHIEFGKQNHLSTLATISSQLQDEASRCLLLVRNYQGYLNLCNLLTRAWLQQKRSGRAEIDFQWLAESVSKPGSASASASNLNYSSTTILADGLLMLSGAKDGAIAHALAQGKEKLAYQLAEVNSRLFPDAFYLEIQRIESLEQMKNSFAAKLNEQSIEATIRLADQLNLPVVATHPVQFMHIDDYIAHEARVCIAEGDLLGNPKRNKRFHPNQAFRSQDEMVAIFVDLPHAIKNTVEIAKRCNLQLTLGQPQLPLFPTPAGLSLANYFVQQANHGLEERLLKLFPDERFRLKQRPGYIERLAYEMKTINKMGFAGYFLIVADFISWAKQNGVPVGPGRGSGAGSLVAYALGITDLDPIRYKLLFERFLNPERISMPDFDIDFCQHGRDSVIHYVKQKYGANAVSQIATFGTMAAKAAIRDVGRVLDLGYGFTDSIAKLIPFRPGKLVTIDSALIEEPTLAARYEQEEEVKQLIDLAKRLEGITRNVGMHAGGVLIAPGKLTDFCPLYTQGEESGAISQYDKDDVEAIGLVKFDFLGLTTLTILSWSERYIRELNPEKKGWQINDIELNDALVFGLLKSAKTVAVFQLESRGMQGMLKDAQPDRFEDIIALVALFRPGPMDLIPSFCARKHGREAVVYPDPRVAAILEETYGIMVYQEQVMQMAQIIGGYSLGSADLLRRAMGKKKAEEMAQQRAIFKKGALNQGLSAEKASEIFDLMEKFAGYGFNKSHAAAYALLAYQTAWMKVHYPAEFMAANLSLAMDDTDKIKILIDDCKALGITVLPPDINLSSYYFVPCIGQSQPSAKPFLQLKKIIYYGLGALKGSGQNAINEIEKARSNQPFTSLFDLCARVNRTVVNRRTFESLIRSGALDSLESNRACLLSNLNLAMTAAEQFADNHQQSSLFENEPKSTHLNLKAVAAWNHKQELKEEKSVVGFFLSGHPFDHYSSEIKQFIKHNLSTIKAGPKQTIAGMIVSMRTQMTPRGKILLLTLDDAIGQCEVVIFNELYQAKQALFQEDELLIVQGRARDDSYTGNMRLTAENVMSLTQARSYFAQFLNIEANHELSPSHLAQLLAPYVNDDLSQKYLSLNLSNKPNLALTPIKEERPTRNERTSKKNKIPLGLEMIGLPIRIHYSNREASVKLKLSEQWRVQVEDELLINLKRYSAIIQVNLVY